ncbi:MAG: lysylphosphatidylglycerol synthase transmembrane domain-containing protein [Polyangia bacterium]
MQIETDGRSGQEDEALLPATASPGGKRRRWLRTLVALAATAGLFVLMLQKVDLAQFLATLRQAQWQLVAAVALLSLIGCHSLAILRLWTLLRVLPRGVPSTPPAPGEHRGLGDVTSIYLATTAAHNLLPSFAGDALRTVQLHRRHGYPLGTLIAAQLVERVLEALGLSLVTLGVVLALPLPSSLARPLGMFAVLGVGGALLLLLLARRHRPGAPATATASSALEDSPALWARLLRQLRHFVAQLAEGVYHLRRPTTWGGALLWSVAGDAINTLTVGLCLWSVGVSLPVSGWFLVMLAGRASGLLPTTPGQFGVMEGAMVLALGFLGVAATQALPFALLFHVAHFVPVTVVGLIEARRHL